MLDNNLHCLSRKLAMLKVLYLYHIKKSFYLLLEAHLLDFDGNIYDKDIKVSFVKKIRNEQKFASLPDLKSQLVKDENEVREFFGKNKTA